MLSNTPKRREIMVGLMEGLRENLQWFPRYQAYLREARPPTLIVWGPQDGYMPEKSARAYLRDVPEADFHLLDGGHWLLETNLFEVVERVRVFLDRVDAGASPMSCRERELIRSDMATPGRRDVSRHR
jgi:pimeloyl-ACP methyl ester carboxylesterase